MQRAPHCPRAQKRLLFDKRALEISRGRPGTARPGLELGATHDLGLEPAGSRSRFNSPAREASSESVTLQPEEGDGARVEFLRSHRHERLRDGPAGGATAP